MITGSNPMVVMVVYQRTAAPAPALASLGGRHALFVVEDRKDPEATKFVSDYGGRFRAPRRNVGSAASVNVALAASGERDVLLLKPEARVSSDLPQALDANLDVSLLVGVDRRPVGQLYKQGA